MASSTDPPPVAGAGKAERPPLRVGVVTLFPELFEPFGRTSFVGRSQRSGMVELTTFNLRDHGLGRHQSVDDTPYGGGAGMVMRVDCIVAAIEAAEEHLGLRTRRLLMTPQGTPFRASTAQRLAVEEGLLFVCGRYEGFDERVRGYVDEEISLGDFVLTGGEIPAMAMIEATIRFVPQVLGNSESAGEESFSPALSGGLEYPQYTRPAEFRGATVPEVLSSGDHGRVAQWRAQQSVLRTRGRRPDLLAEGRASAADGETNGFGDTSRASEGPSGER